MESTRQLEISEEVLSDCESCVSSQTSTDLYGHEPYESFVHKALNLLALIFPNDQPIEMQRLAGGSYNRVVSGVLNSTSRMPTQVILRVPRFTYLRPADEVAVLQFVAKRTSIPVPEVLHFDPTADNPIAGPYMLLSLLPGRCLGDIYNGIPFEKKKRVIYSFARLLGQLSGVTFEKIGVLRATSTDDIIEIGEPWDESEHLVTQAKARSNKPPASRSILSFLEERWAYFIEEEQRRNPGDSFDVRYTAAFRAAASKPSIPAADVPARIVLFHIDLAPRNIFVDVETGEITGVLDWDRAESAPVEAAWTIPAWLWDEGACGSNQLEWESPDKIPADQGAAELREVFLEEIGKTIPDFMDVVRRSRLVRELLFFARLGLRSGAIIDRANRFLQSVGVEVAEKPPEQ